MDQNQTIDNDLQKAIDDITNTTNTDPVFSDPVATPSSLPEINANEINNTTKASAKSIPDLTLPNMKSVPPFGATAASKFSPTSETSTPSTNFATPVTSVGTSAPSSPSNTMSPFNPSAKPTDSSDMTQIKTAALRDLAPLIGKLHLGSAQKFNLYRNIIEDLHDSSVLEQAYQSARDITDETERAEALLYLVESIDKM